jgi:hypothetical protein
MGGAAEVAPLRGGPEQGGGQVILPNVRAGFGAPEIESAIDALRGVHEESAAEAEERLARDGLDSVLDDPRVLNALLGGERTTAERPPLPLLLYVFVRHALLEGGVDDSTLSDYVAALLLSFGQGDCGPRPDGEDYRYEYLTDLLERIDGARGPTVFLLQAHMGDTALWLSGVFPDRVTARVQRRGAPGLDYFETLGAAGYQAAARSRLAAAHGLDGVLERCGRLFPALRVSLNRISDRYFFPRAADPVERLLRQTADIAVERENWRIDPTDGRFDA